MNAKKYAGVAWPGVFVVLTGTYAYWASQRELVSSRPSAPSQFDVPDPVPTPGVRTVHSRMWEDPLSTAFQDWKSLGAEDRAPRLRTISDKEIEGDADDADASTDKLASETLAIGNLVNGVKNAFTTGETAAAPSRTAILRADMKEHYRDLVDKGPTVCLPIFVPGGPYAEDKERRMRSRYAVVTALAESGYALKVSDEMSYLVAKIYVRVLRGWQEREIVVPVKLYRDDHGKRPQVLVLWINELELGLRPLLAMHRILNEIFSEVKNKENLDVSIVGPSSSDTLKNMASDAGHPKPGEWKKLTDKVVAKLKRPDSPTNDLEQPGLRSRKEVAARLKELETKCKEEVQRTEAAMQTEEADPESIRLNRELEELEALQKEFASLERAYHWEISSYAPDQPIEGFAPLLVPIETINDSQAYKVASVFSSRATMDGIEFPENPYFKFYRVIGADHQLAAALREELELRGVLPGKVVLITEHDTAYGRMIQGTFEQAFGETQDHQATQAEKKAVAATSEIVANETDAEKEAEAKTVYTFRILRGIDGILPGDAKDSSQSSGGQGEQAAVVERPPEGRSQYDYLKRLPERIRTELPEGPVAIGVVGSDVYDKLLVLRALRPQFPDCVFFTTDLHAIYTHPNERQHTRNLVTASHFGTNLGNRLQRETPPFRDSYQTATFLATRLAIVADKTLNRATNFEMEAGKLEAAAGENYFVKAVAKEIRAEAEKIRHADSPQALLLAVDKIQAAAETVKTDVGKYQTDPVGFKQQIDVDRRVEKIIQKAVAARSETEVAEHWKVWNDVLSKLGSDDRENAMINPMIHIIGRSHTHQLTKFDADSTEAKVHPAPSQEIRGWHICFIAAVTCGVLGGVLLLTVRDRFRISLLLNRGCEHFEAAWIDRVQPWRRGLNTGIRILLGIGLFLIAGLMMNAWWGNDIVSPLGGYTTWTRNILYSVTGMLAVLFIAYLVDRFIVTLNEAKHVGGKVCERAWETFQMTQIVKGAVLAVVLIQAGTLFVWGFNSNTIFGSIVRFGGLIWAAWYFHKPRSEKGEGDPSQLTSSPRTKLRDDLNSSLILSPNPAKAIWWAIGLMFAITGLAALVGMVEAPRPGWSPVTISRHWITRNGDLLTRGYAFLMVSTLIAALLYCYFWCIEFSQYAKQHISANFPSSEDTGLQMESELDRLWLVSKLTSVAGSLAPAVMGLLLLLVFAYHPLFSPTPMPMGLLVMFTIILAGFLIPVVLVRWHFSSDRNQVLAELQNQMVGHPRYDDRRGPGSAAPPTAELGLTDDDGIASEMAPVLPSGELSENETEVQQQYDPGQAQPSKSLPPAAAPAAAADRKQILERCKQQIAALSEGVFKPWAESPMGWILGGGASLAMIDLWVRWWTIGL